MLQVIKGQTAINCLRAILSFYIDDIIKTVSHLTSLQGVVIDTQFSWGLFEALEQSFLLNTTPEFEIAAYTVCALAGSGTCTVKVNNAMVSLQVSTVSANGTAVVISGCVPEADGGSSSHTTKHPSSKTTKASTNDPQLQTLVDQMRTEDVDKPSQTDYKLNWGNKVGSGSNQKLFSSMNENIFSRKVYDVLIQVFDQNLFTPDVCTAEPALSGSRKVAFLNVIDTWTSTTVFQSAFNYLKSKGVKEATDMNTMKNFLFNFWFGTYSRCKGPLGSSGFEHVFSGEFKSNTVDGQHNWQRYYLLEKAGKIVYNGYYNYDAQLIGTFQYKWAGNLKQKGGFFFGTSPAFDFSLLTVCSLVHSGANGCRFTIDGYKLAVTSYTQECGAGLCLATAYPTD
ncbi:unnamed protein product [Auanema sp. JU1783]|nr:unnamed protein product [Auanema sp. JU1783]